jgi:lipid A 3-O-deacylase
VKSLFGVLGLLTIMGASPALAGTTNYDMSSLLFQEHPFASTGPLAPVIARPYVQQRRAPAPIRRAAAAPIRRASQPAPRRVSAPQAPLTYPRQSSAMAPAAKSEGLWGMSEIRIGALVHDIGPFSSNEEDGFDGNIEVLFVSPGFLDIIWAPRPHLGLSVNSVGDTSQVYAGLSWEWSFWGHWFAGFSLGGSVHDGKFVTNRIDRKELGCRVLFRESIEVGYRFGGKHAISGFLDHISNANICDKNEGLETTGIRYGYMF